MSDNITSIQQEALTALESIYDAQALQAWKTKYLGQKGAIRDLLSQISSIPAEQRKEYGQSVNALKNGLTEAHEQRETLLKDQALAKDLEEGELDVTLPGRPHPTGGLHPSTRTLRDFQHI